jgi:SAM-dependent MidA family methyltransferase
VSRDQSASLSTLLCRRISAAIEDTGGWLPFDQFMALALYAPGLGYYSRDNHPFGRFPGSGSDFVTAPELSPLFGRCLAAQVQQALDAAGSGNVWEFGAGSGALAEQLLNTLDTRIERYAIVDLSGTLRSRQAQRLQSWRDRIEWLDAWPPALHGVVLGNEVLDAMPVQLLRWDGERWFERGVASHDDGFAWSDRPTRLRPPPPCSEFVPGTVTEIHPQAEAFVRSLAERLQQGAAFFVDYGFPEHEYYHPQRVEGTLMCHRAHLVDSHPLVEVGTKDITSHVNFSAVALAGQAAGLDVLGYTSQARFLINCGLTGLLQQADVRQRSDALKLIHEHEMGELFKVIGFSRGLSLQAIGFAVGDRSHTL